MGATPLPLLAILVLALTSHASASKCRSPCHWPDDPDTLCYGLFANIFYGKVERVYKKSDLSYVDYSVEILKIYRSENSRYVHDNAVVTLRTSLHTKICPIKKMFKGETHYFAVGQLGRASDNYRIKADSCDSYIRRHLRHGVRVDLESGKFNTPC